MFVGGVTFIFKPLEIVMSLKKMLAKKPVKKAILYSALLKVMVTLAGFGFFHATGAALPQPLAAVETQMAAVFQTNDAPAHLGSTHFSKVGSAIQVM